MKRMLSMLVMGAMIFALSCGDLFARSSSRSSSRSRSSSGYSKSSKPKSQYTAPKAKAKSTSYKKSAVKSTSPKKSSGGFGKKKVDTKSAGYQKTNAQIKKDFGTSNKKYSSMKEAKSDLGGKMASKRYTHADSKTAMAHRPSNIPQSYQGNTTVYMNGGYGYYRGSMFMPYMATHMIISDSMMHSYAPNAYNQHVVVQRSGGAIALSILLSTLIIIGGVVFIVKISQ